MPTDIPTVTRIILPTQITVFSPATGNPSLLPTSKSAIPSIQNIPSSQPTSIPTILRPTSNPTMFPFAHHSMTPSIFPSQSEAVTNTPSTTHSSQPTATPSIMPTELFEAKSSVPTTEVSFVEPSPKLTFNPSLYPSMEYGTDTPTVSLYPSLYPSEFPVLIPFSQPTYAPTKSLVDVMHPSSTISNVPSSTPSNNDLTLFPPTNLPTEDMDNISAPSWFPSSVPTQLPTKIEAIQDVSPQNSRMSITSPTLWAVIGGTVFGLLAILVLAWYFLYKSFNQKTFRVAADEPLPKKGDDVNIEGDDGIEAEGDIGGGSGGIGMDSEILAVQMGNVELIHILGYQIAEEQELEHDKPIEICL